MSTTARSPLSGCTILIAAVVMLLFLIGFSIWQPIRQAKEMEKFTQDAPAPVAQLKVEEHEEQAKALVERMELFRSDLSDKEEDARLALTAEEMNLAIALFEPLKELRGTFHVDSVEEDHVKISICYQLNRLPEFLREDKGGSDYRYLVGTLSAKPMLSKREFVVSVDSLDVPGAEVPEGFMGHFSTLRIFEQSKDHPTLGPVMASLTAASLEDGKLVFARVPGDPIPDVVTDEQFQKTGGKIMMFLGGGILIFLLFAGTLLFLGYRAQLRKIEAEEKTNQADSDA